MNPYNYNYYGLPTQNEFINQDSIKIGDLVPLNIWGYYYDGNPDNADKIGKPLDDSVYLWKIKQTAAYATNAAYSIATGNTLNIDVAYNQNTTPVNVAMAASDVSGVDSDYAKGFYPAPDKRAAYDKSTFEGYQHTGLFYDIRYNGFCAVPQCAVYKMDGTDTFAAGTLDGLAAIIDAAPTQRFLSYFRYDLYSGSSTHRRISEYYNEGTFKTIAMPDILSDRPIPASCTVVRNVVGDVNASPEHNPAWINDKVYSPFSAALRRDWSLSYTESSSNQYSAGFTQQYTPSDLRTGCGEYGGGRVTGQFFKYNPTPQYFDDVAYQWDIVIYDSTAGVFVNTGMDITNLTHNLRFMTKLTILDKKDAATIGAAVVRAVKHEIAYMGFYFADNATLGQSAVLGSAGNGQGVYLPEKINRTTTGNYFTGEDIAKQSYCDASSVSDFEYNPSEDINDSGDLTTHLKKGYVAGGQWYKLTPSELSALSTWLNTTYKPDEQTLTEDFKGVNPSDYIISLKYYPFNVSAGSSGALSIGGLDTGTTAAYFTRFYGSANTTIDNSYFNLGSFTMQPPYCFGNFLDKYLKIQVYIPYCGFVDLDSSVYCPSPDGTIHTINIALQVDYATGQCVGLIFRDALLMDTVQGCCGVDIPFSAVQQGNYQNNVKQAELAIKQAKTGQLKSILAAGGAVIGTAAAAFTGNVPGVLLGSAATVSAVQGMKTADISRESADYNLEHTAPSVSGVESASPFNAMIQEDSAKILIYKPVTLQGSSLADYAQTVGYACCRQGKLSTFNGLTVCSDAKLNFDAPAAHKTQLQQMLLKGVYV